MCVASSALTALSTDTEEVTSVLWPQMPPHLKKKKKDGDKAEVESGHKADQQVFHDTTG